MNILTPIPVYVAEHRGVKNHRLTNRYGINTYKASLLVGELPEGVCVKKKYSGIEYRYVSRSIPNKMGWQTQTTATIWVNNNYIEYGGWLSNQQQHKEFIDTYNLIEPIINELLSTYAKAA